jgi:hypothetical protein
LVTPLQKTAIPLLFMMDIFIFKRQNHTKHQIPNPK